MDRKTHYSVLGVSRAEDGPGIRAAYRERARKLHPDVAGEQGAPAFRELTEAYCVLSDPERRRRYNDELARSEGPPAEATSARAPHSAQLPELEELLEFEVWLTRDEWQRGSVVPILVPCVRICPRCRGAALDCPRCGRRAPLLDEYLVQVRIPALATPGSVFELTLHDLGPYRRRLRLHLLVQAWSDDGR